MVISKSSSASSATYIQLWLGYSYSLGKSEHLHMFPIVCHCRKAFLGISTTQEIGFLKAGWNSFIEDDGDDDDVDGNSDDKEEKKLFV